MRTLENKTCMADADLWYKSVIRHENGFEYYTYFLLYVDDCLCIHHDADKSLNEIDTYFPMKKGLIGDTDIYLGSSSECSCLSIMFELGVQVLSSMCKKT